jgi:thioredoxin 1
VSTADEKPLEIADGDFASVISQGNVPILVDFWAPWCAPCKKLTPVIDQLAVDYAGKAVITKMNTQVNRTTPAQLGIRGIPTVIIFKDGKEVERMVGVQPKKAYQNALNKHMVVPAQLEKI